MLGKLLCFVAILGLSQSMSIQSEDKSTARFGHLNRYFWYNTNNIGNQVEVFDVIDVQETFTPGGQVVIFVHGHEGSRSDKFNNEMREGLHLYHSTSNINVVVVDWSEVASRDYNFASGAVPDVGNSLATFIVQVIVVGYTDITLIGFDLGAHVCGFAGRRNPQSIRTIIGLSPRGAGWAATQRPLGTGDAQFVEIIHTSNNLGIDRQIGDVDFFVNNGRTQPGCSNHQCHHERAFFIMSASFGNDLRGIPCDTVANAVANRCTSGRGIRVGSITPPNEIKTWSRGVYRMNTVAVYPFQ